LTAPDGASVDALYTSEFRVFGTPVAQGGMRYVPTPNGSRQITVGGVGLKEWRQAIATEAAVRVVEGKHHRGPVALHVNFRYPMPGNRKAAERRQGVIPRTSRPDLDKLIRAVCDSLTVGGLIVDDSQIAELHATKFEYMDSWSGIDVSVRDLWTP
jgi:Holliday junction resolvase RusA-like endonuclease